MVHPSLERSFRALEHKKWEISALVGREGWIKRGVVGLICLPAGRIWLEGSNHIRLCDHRLWRDLSRGRHRCAPLQRDFERHGSQAFRIELLEFVLREDSLKVATQRQQSRYTDRLYNPEHRPRSD